MKTDLKVLLECVSTEMRWDVGSIHIAFGVRSNLADLWWLVSRADVWQGDRWWRGHFDLDLGYALISSRRFDLIKPTDYEVALIRGGGIMTSFCIWCEGWSPMNPIHHEDCRGTHRMRAQLERDARWVQVEWRD